jgi:pimeloyl-ACP methyl ester carboxylesterase
VRPADCDEPLVAEGELVAVIGRPLRHVTAAQARDGIFGWTIGNVVSARGWQRFAVLDAIAAGGGPSRAVLVGQSIGAAAALRAALNRPDRASGVILAHSLGGLQHSELTALVKADRAVAEKAPGARPAPDALVPRFAP